MKAVLASAPAQWMAESTKGQRDRLLTLMAAARS